MNKHNLNQNYIEQDLIYVKFLATFKTKLIKNMNTFFLETLKKSLFFKHNIKKILGKLLEWVWSGTS